MSPQERQALDDYDRTTWRLFSALVVLIFVSAVTVWGVLS
jgi:hypothetical protein